MLNDHTPNYGLEPDIDRERKENQEISRMLRKRENRFIHQPTEREDKKV
jgi:hypothetical protein